MSTQRHSRTSFEFKSARLPLVSLVLRSADLALLTQELQAHLSETPDFFSNDLLVVDLTTLNQDTVVPDFTAMRALLQRHRLCPLAVRGGNDAQTAAALAAGWIHAPDISTAPARAPVPQEVVREVVHEVVREVPAPVPDAMVIERPLRSGQQVYARGTDLIVLALVNNGAEVIADGNIHVYAPLRGRAIAGARGNAQARIFSTSLEAELVSIAGIYKTSEIPFSKEVLGKPAQVRLEGEKLHIEAL